MGMRYQAPEQEAISRKGKESGGKRYSGARSQRGKGVQETQMAQVEITENQPVKSLEELEREFQEYRNTQAEKRGNSGAKKVWQEWRTFIIQTACTMLAFYILLTYVVGITVVHGDSMQPSLHEQDIALIWRLSGEYQEGDIVLFRSVGTPETLVKRVIAGPGDTVEIMDETGQVMVNDVLLIEPYIYAETHSRGGNNQPITLGENEYFVLGDNRQYALDSRNVEIGPVEKGDILGKIVFLFRSGGA